jgi:predicted nucleic acid-binding protein
VLRAGLTRLRTPDAIHAATALELGVALFVTNDFGFRGVPDLPAAVLADVLAAP